MSVPVLRNRNILQYRGKSERQPTWIGSGTPPPKVYNSYAGYGYQETLSENHGDQLALLGKGGDIGGPFYTILFEGPSNFPEFYVRNVNTGKAYYKGPLAAHALAYSLSDFPDAPETDQSEIDAAGTTAIARCAPTQSAASLAVALSEILRDGLPRAGLQSLKERTRIARSAGEDYLNVEFGWLPLANDVRQLCYAVKHSHQLLHQYVRDSGKVVRRKYKFPTTYETNHVDSGLATTTPALPTELYVSADGGFTGPSGYDESTKIERWFSGAFQYWLPLKNGQLESFDLYEAYASRILGFSLTPETLWNAAPWSWAVDWVGNMGDYLHNVSTMNELGSITGGVVMRYGYMMETKTIIRTYFLTDIGLNGVGRTAFADVFKTTRKQRWEATPFGFGLNWDDFSPWQWSIVAALGITRGS